MEKPMSVDDELSKLKKPDTATAEEWAAHLDYLRELKAAHPSIDVSQGYVKFQDPRYNEAFAKGGDQ
jgi:hypothetical protein